MPSNITLKKLACFVAVAEERHFRRAATRLHITQPPLTQTIQVLERDLEVQLFDRTGQRIELTHVGKMLLPEAQAILAHVERLRDVARQGEQGLAGTLRVGVVVSVPFIRAFNEATKAFQRDYPAVVLDLVQVTSGDAIEALRRNKIDICLVRRVSSALPGLRQITVARDRLMLALPSTHAKAAAEKISLSDLAQEGFVSLPGEQRAALYKHTMDVWKRTGLTPKVVQEAESGFTMMALVAAGIGNAILPSTLSDLRMPNVIWKEIDMDARWTSSSIILLYRDDVPEQKIKSSFIKYIQQSSSNHAD